MGGFFGVASKHDCVFDLFYGIDYHSHLGTRRGGMAVYSKVKGFDRSIHNIENSPFRTKFEFDIDKMKGEYGIGCISDYEPQPLLVKSHHGTYALTTVGKINNINEIEKMMYEQGTSHFLEMSGGEINPTELVASIINQKDNLIDGLRYAQELVDGSLTVLLMNEKGLYVSRDKFGRTPAVIGYKEGEGYAVAFESFSYLNLGYTDYKELGPGEIDFVNENEVRVLVQPGNKMRICAFLWVYYGYPCSSYEGLSVEKMRYNCGKWIAKRDKERGDIHPDSAAGVPDSGTAHAVGYSVESGIPFERPFIKYTPTWPRSFMPTSQKTRNHIAHMKLIPVHDLIKGKKLLLIDDSIVRGTQMRNTTQFLYESGAKEVHIRSACPPLLYGCKYLNFSRSNSEMELITRRVISRLEGNTDDDTIKQYINPDGDKYKAMVEEIRKELNFTSLGFNRLDDLKKACEIDEEKLCTYCWDGKE